MDLLGLIGILITLLIALWQSREAAASKMQLDNYLLKLPSVIVQNVVARIESFEPIGPTQANERLISHDNMTSTLYADLDNDGKDELIVEFPVGVHGSAIQIYKIGFEGPTLLAEWSTDVPYGFEIDKSDPTHSPLLVTGETNASSGLPYVAGLRDTVWLKLENGKLVEHKRVEPSKEEIAERKIEIDVDTL